MISEKRPLEGKRIAVPETREIDLFVRMLEDQGATTFRCPLVAILDAPDPQPIEAWLRDLAAGDMDDLILLTGEGLRRLLGFAERAGLTDSVRAALGNVRTIVRGPKPSRALKEIGLNPGLPADEPTTSGVIAALSREELRGRRIGVQLYGEDPNEKLIQFLHNAGAVPKPVAPYIYAPKTHGDEVASLIEKLATDEIDLLAFTSASQVDRLWQVARERGLEPALQDGIQRIRIAAVGPVVVDRLEKENITGVIVPEKSFFLRPLVNAIIAAM